MSIKTYMQAIKDVIAEEMRRDPTVFLIGEDVAKIGGVFGVTRGLVEEFGKERIWDAPISESAQMGIGLGAAITGLRPIVDFQYMDFAFVAMDQLITQIGKMHFLNAGSLKVPFVFCSQQGVGRGNGPTHSQSLEVFFAHFPGLKIVTPSSPADAAGLLRAAIRDDNPVVYIEHKALYNEKGEVPDDPDFMIPFKKANIVKEGKDITLIGGLFYLGKIMDAARILEDEGFSVEVIDPRTLVPFDKDTIVESVKKTGRAVVVHEAHKFCGFGAEIASTIMEEAFRWLDAPVLRIGSKSCHLPFNRGLEREIVPQINEIVHAAKQVLYAS